MDRSDFIGAYQDRELIGFMKVVYTDGRAEPMQILSKVAHADKAPTNALLAKSVELATERQALYLVYGKYVYGKKGIDSLTDFKRHNGFRRFDLPKYFVALSARGRIALKLKLHRQISELLPQGVYQGMLRIRNAMQTKKFGSLRTP